MFRSLCSICADDITSNPHACPCGHIFHIDCLNRWLRQSKTCPECRLKTTAGIKLFLNDNGNNSQSQQGQVDAGALKAEISDLKDKIKKKGSENNTLKKRNVILRSELDQSTKNCQDQQSNNDTLKKQLSYFSKQQQELLQKKDELLKLREQIKKYERLEALLKHDKTDKELLLSSVGEGSKARDELAEQVVFFKREYDRAKEQRKEAREKVSLLERENKHTRTEKKHLEIQLRQKVENLSSIEEEFKQLEKEKAGYQKKIEVLHKALSSHDNASPRTVAITRFVMESPAPLELKRPRLSSPEDTLDDSLVLFDAPESPATLRSSDMEKAAMELGIPCVKTTSTTSSQLFRKPLQDTNMLKPRHALNHKPGIKRTMSDSSTGIIRTGFDGLGGHSKIILPKNSFGIKPKKVARPSPSMSRFVKNKSSNAAMPPLPTLSFD